jgi:hypothetical protein
MTKYESGVPRLSQESVLSGLDYRLCDRPAFCSSLSLAGVTGFIRISRSGE